jgi:beta-phosphoglucomutase-like phosphatase (HAD superfamily)
MLKAVILDFDGVILESVNIKGWVMEELFKDYPLHVKDILDYHYSNGGVSRFDKFRHIYRNILKQPLSEEHFKALCDRFGALSVERVLAVDFVPGAREFLEAFHRRLPLFIVSGTPHEEIRHIVQARGLAPMFKGVYGSPCGKNAWTRQILKEGPFRPEEVLWVGDALSDLEAARDSGIAFAARIAGPKDVFAGLTFDFRLPDLVGLPAVIDRLNASSVSSHISKDV